MIQIRIDSDVPTQQDASQAWSAAPNPFSAEPKEGEAEPKPAGMSADAMLFVSPPPAPWPRVLPGL
jgi:hypothetical protein